jgi:hypothetical protein
VKGWYELWGSYPGKPVPLQKCLDPQSFPIPYLFLFAFFERSLVNYGRFYFDYTPFWKEKVIWLGTRHTHLEGLVCMSLDTLQCGTAFS